MTSGNAPEDADIGVNQVVVVEGRNINCGSGTTSVGIVFQGAGRRVEDIEVVRVTSRGTRTFHKICCSKNTIIAIEDESRVERDRIASRGKPVDRVRAIGRIVVNHDIRAAAEREGIRPCSTRNRRSDAVARNIDHVVAGTAIDDLESRGGNRVIRIGEVQCIAATTKVGKCRTATPQTVNKCQRITGGA